MFWLLLLLLLLLFVVVVVVCDCFWLLLVLIVVVVVVCCCLLLFVCLVCFLSKTQNINSACVFQIKIVDLTKPLCANQENSRNNQGI